MNYGLGISCRLEELMREHTRGPNWTQNDENALYEQVLAKVLEERPEAWASGNIRVGDYILLGKSLRMAPDVRLTNPLSRQRYPRTNRLPP